VRRWRPRRRAGVKLGGKENQAVAATHTETLHEAVTRLAEDGLTTRAIAKALNDRGLKPPRGGAWQAPQITRLLARLELRKPRRAPAGRLQAADSGRRPNCS
jgi:hypothetical protein